MRKILQRVIASPHNVRFADLAKLFEAFGFKLLRVSASHHIFGRAGIPEQLNIQNVRGQAKAYQVRQFLKLIERYNLRLPEQNGE